MKKFMVALVGLALFAGLATAELSVVDKLAFAATGQSATWTIPAKVGSFWDVDIQAYCATAGTVSAYCPIKATTLAVTSAGGTSIEIYATASNVLEGATITTDDFLLVDNAGTYSLANISALGTYVANVQEATVGAFTATAGAKVYLVKSADIITIPVGATSAVQVKGVTVGKLSMPIHFVGSALVGPVSYFCGVANATKP